jgi:hypothetical protein
MVFLDPAKLRKNQIFGITFSPAVPFMPIAAHTTAIVPASRCFQNQGQRGKYLTVMKVSSFPAREGPLHGQTLFFVCYPDI